MPRTTTNRAEIPLPITYTPTTHRISKAKKGKRVHACEYPGCAKVFTRAEHRRRHELNHNPEALYRCTQPRCKKSFHRSDLLARHMERHELEAQMNNTTQWERHSPSGLAAEHYISKCDSVDPTGEMYMAATQPPSSMNSMSLASMKTSVIHPGLTRDCNLPWGGVGMPLDHPNQIYHGQQIHESVEDYRFYSTPEACSSPSSDDTTLSVPSYHRSSVSSTPVATIDSYSDTIVDSELTSSPLPVHASLRSWEQPENSFVSSNMTPMTIADGLIHPALQYQAPTWAEAHSTSYSESVLPAATTVPYTISMGWNSKSWTL